MENTIILHAHFYLFTICFLLSLTKRRYKERAFQQSSAVPRNDDNSKISFYQTRYKSSFASRADVFFNRLYWSKLPPARSINSHFELKSTEHFSLSSIKNSSSAYLHQSQLSVLIQVVPTVSTDEFVGTA